MSAALRSLIRACAAWMVGAYTHTPPMVIAKRQWIADKGAEWLTRAPTAPADPINTPELIRTVVVDFLATLAPQSAAVRILQAGLRLSLDERGKLSLPTIRGDPSYAAFVKTSNPIPVVQGYIDPPLELSERRLASIVVLTAEMMKSSNIEVLIEDALRRSTALALDTILLDDQPGDDTRPAGIRYNVTPLAASAAPDADDAMMLDIAALQDAVSLFTATPPIFVMSPTRAMTANLRTRGVLAASAPVFGSAALLGSNDVIAIAPPVLASAFGDAPEFFASRESAVQMSDTPDTDGTLGTPTRSMWQTDCAALRLQWPITWGVRSVLLPAHPIEPPMTPNGVAWLTATNW